ncbi:uroporphyrinogen-III C-methyltransferase [Rubripirellula reticaptiva]|uniref:uroporphyrinogen-III C-methyltransferase n=1 Tax=Rubripirellula reticaptiva TaxID=2528013 RepID=A0A5C6F7F9_9BACT|nr:uroporphyrinogen-III C-methyltransferase [Rubripirellula reticaptiva]TWU56046.1 Uroporphyrinogen-III C-methyltransferase [Rubripirellula reticaptiva]
MNHSNPLGKVHLIGAGPGDPGLLTLRGAELLRRSDVVLYDGLSNTDLLVHAAAARHICVGKHGQTRIWTQSEIIDEMLTHARAGKVVSRLKGGDPAVFARTAEEVDALRAAGIEFEIVPGITAALAAGSFAGIPITHRGLASAVALVTGHEEPDKTESALDWDALARFPGTLVIYMGVTTAAVWSGALMAAGKPPGTPVALVRRCSLPDQQTVHCRLDEVADRMTPASKFRPPAIVIIGPVTGLAESMDWVTRRPLFGQTVMVSRPIDQAESMAMSLRDLGADVIIQPAIEIVPPDDWTDVDAAIADLANFDVVVFCSHNGVRYFLDRLGEIGYDMRSLAGLRIAVVGSKTAETLASYHLRADLVPTDFRAESLAADLASDVHNQRVLLVRASRGRNVLPEQLTTAGAKVTQVVAYQNRDVESADPAIVARVAAGTVDWVTVTSSASGESLHRMFGQSLHQCKLASLSPITSKALQDLGYSIAAEADPYTIESLIQSITQSQSES